jgi:hypothetical protein
MLFERAGQPFGRLKMAWRELVSGSLQASGFPLLLELRFRLASARGLSLLKTQLVVGLKARSFRGSRLLLVLRQSLIRVERSCVG